MGGALEDGCSRKKKKKKKRGDNSLERALRQRQTLQLGTVRQRGYPAQRCTIEAAALHLFSVFHSLKETPLRKSRGGSAGGGEGESGGQN